MSGIFQRERRKASAIAEKLTANITDDKLRKTEEDRIFNEELARLIKLAKDRATKPRKTRGPHKYAGDLSSVPQRISNFYNPNFHNQ